MKKMFILLVLLGIFVSVSGCRNTVDGMGDDINEAAEDVKDATN